MDGILWTLGAGVSAVFGVALAVSAWEHLRPGASRKPDPWPAAVLAAAAPPRVDVDLGLPAGDVEMRRGILDDAMHRMTQPGSLGDDPALPWVETAPMVGPRV